MRTYQGEESIRLELLKKLFMEKNIMIDEKSKEYYDKKFKTSVDFQKPGMESLYVPLWNEVLNVLKLHKVKKVLDLGCGPGQFAQYALSILPHLDYTGVDFSSEAIKMARAKHIEGKFSCGNIFKTDSFEYAKYDAILLLEVLEHIDEDLKLLSGIKNKLLICTVPNFSAKSHVRHFKSIEDVNQRYSSILSIIDICSNIH